jgi:hypothetical protein
LEWWIEGGWPRDWGDVLTLDLILWLLAVAAAAMEAWGREGTLPPLCDEILALWLLI